MCQSTVFPSAHQVFTARILPHVELHARVYFRHVKCPDRRADCVAEAIALAWKWFLDLTERGKDATAFPTVLADYACRAVHSGRRLCGQERARDAMSPAAQQRHNFTVGSLPNHSSLEGNVWDEALADNMQSPVPEQVIFRCDFPAWRMTRTDRDRRMMDALMTGERTSDVAERFGVTRSRVSQLRRELFQDWTRFTGETSIA